LSTEKDPSGTRLLGWGQTPVVGIEYEMAFPLQDVEYFRSGLKLLFVFQREALFEHAGLPHILFRRVNEER
jgi:hypothetical protein